MEADENLTIASEALQLLDFADTTEAPVPLLAARLNLVNQMMNVLDQLQAAMEMNLIETMEQDDLYVENLGWVERREKKRSTAGSDWAGARRDGVKRITEMVAIDKSTGVIDHRLALAAREAIDLYNRTFSVGGPLKGFRTELALDPDQYIRNTHGGYSVTINQERGR